MKKIILSAILALFVVPTFASAETLVVDLTPTNVSYYNAVTKAANRLLTLQGQDGGWGWDVTSQSVATGPYYLNVTGVTAEALLSAYKLTGNTAYLNAATKAGDFIITSIDASSPKNINGHNLLFLQELSVVTASSTYSNKAAEYFDMIYSSETAVKICSAVCGGSDALYAGYVAYRGWSSSTPNGIVAWDLAPFVEYAHLIGNGLRANELEALIVSNLSVATSTMESYDLGIASGLKVASLLNDGTNTTLYKSLLSSVDGYGTVTDGKNQTTAYVLKAFVQAGDPRVTAAADYLISTFGPPEASSGWLDNGTEFAEVNSEAASALALMLPQEIRYYSIQSALEAANEGDTIFLDSDATTTSQITVNKAITLDGNGHILHANFAKTNNDNNSVIGIVQSGVTVKNITIDGVSGTNLHGINTYLAENVNLDTVTILNTNRSGIVVNGSEVTATNLNTSGNGWNGVNVDPGSGVAVPSVFTLTSGTLQEPVQIKSDGNNVSATATVTVNASEYQKYSIAGTESGFVWANALKNAAVITRDDVRTLYSTIQSAVKAAGENETVNVYPGNYNINRDTVTSVQGQTGWYLPISQNGVTLQGVDSTGNSITSADSVAAYIYSADETPNGAWASQNLVTVFGDDVSIKGLGIMNKISPNKGIEVLGNNFIAENNQFLPVPKTLFASADNYDGGDDITKYGSGVYFNNNEATTTRVATVRNNIFKNSGITFDSFLDNWTVSITNNTFDGNKVWRSGGVDYNYSAVGATTWANQPDFTGSSLDIQDNKFINMIAGKPIVKTKDGMIGTFSATKNWWGTASLTEIMALIAVSGSSTVNISPWYADAAMTTLASEVTETASAKSTVFSAETAYSSDTVSITIPEGTTITGPLTWNGVFNLPEVTTTYTIPSESSGFWYKPTLAIEMGAEGVALTFDKPVKLTFTGQAGKSAGWSQNGTFHKITSTCTSATAPALEAGADCKIDVGSDLIVWTRHSTAFIAFAEEAIPYGGGGGNSASSVVVPTTPASQVAQTAVANTPNTTGQVLGTTISEQASGKSQGKVLGASTASFARDMSIGMRGEDIGELQKMLIAEGLLSGEATNYFGALTKEALAQWQKDNGLPATGYFGPMTRSALSEKEAKKPAVRGVNTFNFSKNLRFGLKGTEVTELQKVLMAQGYLKITIATDYFGPMTKSALVQWQKDNNLPATGYFGPMTREAMLR